MDLDILVVGAGPAGLAFVRSLAGTGLRIGLIERQERAALAAPQADGREIALTHRSIATLQRLGAWERLPDDAAAPLRAAHVLNGGSPFALRFEAEKRGEGPLGQLVSNHHIRAALYETVAEQPDVEWMTGVGVGAARTGRDGAEVVLADGRTLRAKLLVAADSRLSTVRGQLGIGAEINRLGRSMMVCRVTHEREHEGVATEWFDHGQTYAMLPLNGRMSSAVLTLPTAEIDGLMALSPEALGEELTRRYRRRLGTMRVAAAPHAYPLVTTMAHRFVTRRAALIGDTAVGMHPVTAHGFNFGLLGQAALAEKIVRAARRGGDIADAAMLRRYEVEHKMATLPLYAATNMLVKLYTDERLPARLARGAVLRLGAGLPLARRGVSALLMQH